MKRRKSLTSAERGDSHHFSAAVNGIYPLRDGLRFSHLQSIITTGFGREKIGAGI